MATPNSTMMHLLTPRWGMPPRRFHREQYEVRTSSCRGRLMDCGRRSGKTLLATEILVSHLLDMVPNCPQMRYALGAPIQEQANEIFWDLLLDLIPESWIPGGRDGDHVSLSTRNIRLANGANIKVAGLDKPHRIEGKWLNGFVGTEWSDCKPGIFDKTIRPMLSDYHGWYIIEGVPKRQGIGARDYRKWCEKVTATEVRRQQGLPSSDQDYPDCMRRTWPAWDIVASREIEEARATMDPADFLEQFGAQWLNAGGSVFHEFSREYNVRPCEHRDGLPIIVGSDFNRTPMSWTLCHKVGDNYEAFDEIVMTNTNTQRTLNELWRRWGHHKGGWQFYGDASGRSGSTKSEYSDYTIIANNERFKKAGRTMHYPPENPSRHDRFSAANARLCSADGVHHAFIDPKCHKLIEDLEMRAYIPGTMKLPENEGAVGHSSDSWSYPIVRLWPLRFNMGKGNNRIITTDGIVPNWPVSPDPTNLVMSTMR